MLLPDEWTNFLEQIGVKSESDLITNEHKLERRLWASYRGQTLARTIRGVMCAEEAVMCLSKLCDNASVAEAKHLASYKFSYVVSCQIYGKQAKNNDQNCQAIDLLMHRYKNLRIAYIDEKTTTTNAGQKSEFFSVLVKSSVDEVGNNTVVEVYRIKLPGMPIIGEGKPENQNHAIIFSRGENLQALDMNQVNNDPNGDGMMLTHGFALCVLHVESRAAADLCVLTFCVVCLAGPVVLCGELVLLCCVLS